MKRAVQAERVGAALPKSRLHPAVARFLERPRRGSWCVAVSGGADSVALLLWLYAHWPERRGDLVVLHFDHRQRGAASAADARFCRKLAGELGARFRLGVWSKAPSGASEAAARGARHEFFAREMARYRSRVLWLAHHQDDVAETMLMRLARGSGAGGLAAPRPVQELPGGRVHVRPLLDARRTELESALRDAGVRWREDATNASERYLRNRVRQHVLPAWIEAARRDAVAGAALSRELLEEDDAALEALADASGALRGRQLDLERFAATPRAVRRRLLHRWLLAVPAESDLSRQGFAGLLQAVERGRPTRFSLGQGFAVVRSGSLVFERTRSSRKSR